MGLHIVWPSSRWGLGLSAPALAIKSGQLVTTENNQVSGSDDMWPFRLGLHMPCLLASVHSEPQATTYNDTNSQSSHSEAATHRSLVGGATSAGASPPGPMARHGSEKPPWRRIPLPSSSRSCQFTNPPPFKVIPQGLHTWVLSGSLIHRRNKWWLFPATQF